MKLLLANRFKFNSAISSDLFNRLKRNKIIPLDLKDFASKRTRSNELFISSSVEYFAKLFCNSGRKYTWKSVSLQEFFYCPKNPEVWEGIWNQTHLGVFYCPYTLVVWDGIWSQNPVAVLVLCHEGLHHAVISHDKARSNRWCQWPELLITYRTVNCFNRDSEFFISILQYRYGSNLSSVTR